MKAEKMQKQNSIAKNIGIVWREVMIRYPKSRVEVPVSLILNIAEPFCTTLIPSLAIAGITKGDAKDFVIYMTIALAIYWTLNLLRNFLDVELQLERTYTRLGKFIQGFMRKSLCTDFLNIEPQPRQKIMQQACMSLNSNWVGSEQVMTKSFQLAVQIFGLLAYGSAVLMLDVKILLVTLVMFVFDILLRTYAIRYSDRHREEKAQVERKINYIKNNSMSVSAGKDIRIYGVESWFHDVFENLIKENTEYVKKNELRWYFPTIADVTFNLIRDLLAYSILIAKVLNGDMDVATFTLYLGIVAGFSNWIYSLSDTFNSLRKASHEFNDYICFMDTPDIFAHHVGETKSLTAPKTSSYATPEIEFKNVSFCYEGSDTPVFENLSFRIKAGEKIALVGNNGAGKTTIVKLLCGLYPVTSGEILINGENIQKIGLETYQDQISVLFQDTELMAFSIAMNVAGQEEEDIDYEKVRESLKKADLWEKVDRLPHKEKQYITQNLEDDGIQLSGGETQKLLLARSLYKGGSLLVLDEPTAALDPLAESNIYEKYNEMAAGKTALFISHRLASTKFCDRIFFLADGEVAECGTHEELMEKGGKYREMFEVQSHYYQEKVVTEHEEA